MQRRAAMDGLCSAKIGEGFCNLYTLPSVEATRGAGLGVLENLSQEISRPGHKKSTRSPAAHTARHGLCAES